MPFGTVGNDKYHDKYQRCRAKAQAKGLVSMLQNVLLGRCLKHLFSFEIADATMSNAQCESV